MRKYFIIVSILLNATVVLSQSDSIETCNASCICSTDPTPAGVMISHVHDKNEWMLSYRNMNMGMNGLLSGSKSVTDIDVFTNYIMSPTSMKMEMHMIMGMYGITDRLTAMVMLNYYTSSMYMSMFMADGYNHADMVGMDGMSATSLNNHEMKTSGFSDTKIKFLYGLKKHRNYQVLVNLGCNIPSGSIRVKGSPTNMMYPNNRFPYGMQLGSGTFDLLPGISYLFQKSRSTFSSQIFSVLHLGYNQVGYKVGNEITLNSWFAYSWLKNFSTSIRIEGTVSSEIQGFDPTLYSFNEPSANPMNYGGVKAFSYLGTTYQFKNNRLGIEYGIPIYQNLNGIQMKQNQSVLASWSYAF